LDKLCLCGNIVVVRTDPQCVDDGSRGGTVSGFQDPPPYPAVGYPDNYLAAITGKRDFRDGDVGTLPGGRELNIERTRLLEQDNETSIFSGFRPRSATTYSMSSRHQEKATLNWLTPKLDATANHSVRKVKRWLREDPPQDFHIRGGYGTCTRSQSKANLPEAGWKLVQDRQRGITFKPLAAGTSVNLQTSDQRRRFQEPLPAYPRQKNQFTEIDQHPTRLAKSHLGRSRCTGSYLNQGAEPGSVVRRRGCHQIASRGNGRELDPTRAVRVRGHSMECCKPAVRVAYIGKTILRHEADLGPRNRDPCVEISNLHLDSPSRPKDNRPHLLNPTRLQLEVGEWQGS